MAAMTAVATVEATPKVYNAACEYLQQPQDTHHLNFDYIIDDESKLDFDLIDIKTVPGSGLVDFKSEAGSGPTDSAKDGEPK